MLFTFWFMKILFTAHFHQKNFQKKVGRQFFLGSGSGSGRFQNSDPDPVKNRPDPQHWLPAMSWSWNQQHALLISRHYLSKDIIHIY
jgi:hypothetical protein